jgi:hypothetical protein
MISPSLCSSNTNKLPNSTSTSVDTRIQQIVSRSTRERYMGTCPKLAQVGINLADALVLDSADAQAEAPK